MRSQILSPSLLPFFQSLLSPCDLVLSYPDLVGNRGHLSPVTPFCCTYLMATRHASEHPASARTGQDKTRRTRGDVSFFVGCAKFKPVRDKTPSRRNAASPPHLSILKREKKKKLKKKEIEIDSEYSLSSRRHLAHGHAAPSTAAFYGPLEPKSESLSVSACRANSTRRYRTGVADPYV